MSALLQVPDTKHLHKILLPLKDTPNTHPWKTKKILKKHRISHDKGLPVPT